LYLKGVASEGIFDYKQATVSYKKCLTLDLNNLQASTALGLLLVNQREADRALKYFNHTLKVDPTFVPALIGTAKAIALSDK
jgi:tetratricopeptide (TPR) repeat protein